MLLKTQQRECQDGSYVFVDTESVGSRRNHFNILVWRVVGHAAASGADAGPCIFN